MPPQGYLILGGLGWNYVASRMGKPTISMFARRHKVETAVVLVGGLTWLVPHLFWTAAAVAELIEQIDDRPVV